ncbi:MAG: hypothetical protein IJX28_01395 [Clostridia bacterium]|nr:hypothetical protein [Clostridia bacterium]
MVFQFGSFCVDVDVERTREFYHNLGKTVLEDCGCSNCRNYYASISRASDKVKAFFDSLGIDPQKSPEATWWDTDDNGVAYYSLCFHIVGTLVKSVDIYRPIGNNGFEQILENYHEIDKGFKVGFTSNTVLLEKDFPQPCIQLEIDAHLPWILD